MSANRYREQVVGITGPFMLEQGFLYGLVAEMAVEDARRHHKKITLDTALRIGRLYYRSASGRFRPKDLWAEGCLLFWGGQGNLHPYFGLGYRFLFDDLTVAGSRGYHRFQTYQYIPYGISITWMQHPHSTWFLEYDAWITGHNQSADYRLYQRRGWGLKSGVRCVVGHYRGQHIIVEPYINYWHVRDSEHLMIQEGRIVWLIYEPYNTSVEIGVRLRVG